MRRSHALLLLPLLLAACGQQVDDPAQREDAVVVTRFEPLGTVDGTRPIQISFSKPLSSVVPDPKDLVTITPRIGFTTRWLTPDVLELSPRSEFSQSTRYRVSIRPEIAGDKLKLLGTTEFELNTKMFALLSVEPFFETKDALAVRVNLELSYPVRPSDVRGAVVFLDKDKKVIPSKLVSETIGTVMAFELEPMPLSTEARVIDVRIDGALSAIGGGEPLGKEILRSITLGKPEKLSVVDVQPVQSGEKYQAQIRLSTNIDLIGGAKYISVSPAVEYRLVDTYHGVILDGAFEPGKIYNITLKKGLTGRNGALLGEDVTREMTTPDLDPALRFTSDGTYLMRSGKRNIAVETVNVKSLGVRVSKVFENNLAHIIPQLQPARGFNEYCEEEYCGEYYDEYSGGSNINLDTLGKTVLTDGTVEVENKKNTLLTSGISFDDLDLDSRRGLYRLEVFDRDRSWVRLEKWLVATDLGIIAKIGPGYARAQVVSLQNSRPVPDVEVSFVSRTNEVLGTAMTNAGGVAQLKGNFERKGEPLTLVLARRGRDFSYLVLQGSGVATQELDSGGHGESTAPYRAYLFTERGIYRPGDRAQLSVLVREHSLKEPPNFPLEIEIRDPAWRIFTKLRGSTGEHGAYFASIDIPRDAPTGRYVARVLASGGVELGQTQLMVEDFMPDRLRVDVTPKTTTVEAGSPAEFNISSNYLFGPKAAGLRIESQCSFELAPISTGEFSGFELQAEDAPTPSFAALQDLGEAELDAEGKLDVSCALDEGLALTAPVRATLLTVVSEEGGRAVSGAGSAIIHPHETYVGLRRNAPGQYVELGQDASLEAIAVDRSGKPKEGVKLKVTISEIEYQTILKLVNNRYQYVSESSEKQLSTLEATTERGPTTIPFTPPKQGEMRVLIEDEGGARASLRFWVSGSGNSAWSMRYPDRVAMTLDKTNYRPGETARVLVRAPFEGRIYLSIERDQVLWAQDFPLEGNTGTFNIPVLDVMSPNAYVVAELIRSPDSRERLAPARAFGVTPLFVDAEHHRLNVTVHPDDTTIRPNTSLHVRVKVEGVEKKAFMVVAAVDEGILQVTGFKTPDPFAFFTERRRLSLTTHDLFSQLLPEEQVAASALSVGSGGDAEIRRKHLNPISVKRVKPVAIWSGLVPVGPDGWGVATLEVPEFSGSLRVMAVAWADERFGSGSKNVTVKDPLVLTPTLPRFVAPLDRLVMPVEVYNGTGRPADVTVKLNIDGKIKSQGAAEQKVKLAAEERKTIEWELLVDEVVGQATVTLTAEANNFATKNTTELSVRPPNTVTTESRTAAVNYAQKATISMPGGFIPGSTKARIKIGPTPTAQLGTALEYLLQYPYGCLEQTTSRAFPLLYVRELARREGVELARDRLVDDYVNGAIDRITAMILPEGGLSFWPGGGWGYAWTTVYAAHFLVEAKNTGYNVDSAVLDTLLTHLSRIAAGVTLSGYAARAEFKDQTYALYVLSQAGKPDLGALLYSADRLAKSADPATASGMRVTADDESRALLAGALFIAGQRTKANEIFAVDFTPATAAARQQFWSPVRQDAVALLVLMDVQPTHRSVPGLMDSVAKSATSGRWSNTQENAFALMALGKAYKRLGGGKEYWGTFTAGDTTEKKFNSVIVATIDSTGEEWIGKELNFSVTGAGTAFVGLTVEGIKAGTIPEKSDQLTISRRLLDPQGQAIDLQNIRQGDLVIVEITVTAKFTEGRLENLAVVDLLPAGLEVENPRLMNAASSLSWMTGRSEPEHLDVRDDRILFFGSVWAKQPTRFYYAARAVTRGTFTLPHVFAEAMYDPAFRANAGAGTLQIKPRD
jgi:uncharacterized protein YfaS (alpha-2-macroglobulin family)